MEDGKTEGKSNEFNYNNINNINANDTYHISSYQQQEADAEDVIDEKYRYIISKNIDYECLKQNYGNDMADGVLELMTEIVCCRKPIVVVACQELPQAMVKERFLKLEYTHIEYVFDCLKKNGSRVRNIKSYMITMLYNSYTTIELDEYEIEKLNAKLQYLENADEEYKVVISYFVSDKTKSGGAYVSKSGVIIKVREYERDVVMDDGTKIPIDDIYSISGSVFDRTEEI